MTGLPEAERFDVRPRPAAGELRHRLALAGVWLAGCALLILFARSAIAGFRFTDPDDIMRMMEVRAWLAGQSWFDVTQYRLNPPAGYAMHWSRLVDVPIGAVEILLKPWFGQRIAETGAFVVVPLLTLAIVTLLVSGIARRLYGTSAALLAALFCFLNAGTFSAIWPMRIDHHGWEAAGGLGIVFFLTRKRDARNAALAGLCAAAWTHISLEGLAFTAGAAAWLGLRWLFAPVAEGRRMPAFLASLAAASLGLFLTTHPAALLAHTFCDAISPVHMAVFATAALLTAGAAWRPMSLPLRLAALVAAAAACAAIYTLWAPQCAKGPFAMLTPLVYAIWYRNVLEGLPVWHYGLAGALFWTVGPVIGLIGGATAIRNAGDDALRARLIDYTGLLAVAAAVGVMVLRAGIFANLLALPGQAGLILLVLLRVEAWASLIRVLVRALAVVLLSPMGPQFLLEHLAHHADQGDAAPPAEQASALCATVDNFKPLDALPPATFMTPFDIAPALIAGSHHDAVASGYHRNAAAMDDVLRFFGSGDAVAHAIAERHRTRYLAYCAGDNMTSFLARLYPRGVAARLVRGDIPAWLHPVDAGGAKGLRLYTIDLR